MDNHTRGGRAPKRPAISAPLNQNKIEKARAWVKASGQRWLLRDAKRLWLDLNPSRHSGVTQSWNWRRQLDGRTRDHGLGSWPETSIERARILAFELERKFRETGVHPTDLRRQEKSAAAVAKATQLSFGEAAALFFRQVSPGWRSVKSAHGWRATVLGTRPDGTPSHADWCRRLRPVLLADITTPLVVSVLEERWADQPATGPRVAQRIASVFAWCLARQLRAPPNPADWSVLSKALSAPTRREAHHAAMDWRTVPGFFAELQRRPGIAARALQFTILSAARTNETLGAQWSEFSDLDGAAPTWTIPAQRMKGGKEHRVPLSRAAVALLKALPWEAGNPLVFVSSQPGKPMSPDSMLRVLKAMGHAGITAHGFRSAFSDFAHERTKAEPLLVEAALAHAAGDKVAKAYRRGDLFEKRRALMERWAAFLLSGEAEAPQSEAPEATVVQLPLHGGAR
jgi:integrase